MVIAAIYNILYIYIVILFCRPKINPALLVLGLTFPPSGEEAFICVIPKKGKDRM